MTPAHIAELRKETVEMFYHGFDNYMDIAFPEDEVRSVNAIKPLPVLIFTAATSVLPTIDPRLREPA
jgi:hypothetical protein